MKAVDGEGRSIKSEYDYGSKRKFVDVLGNFNPKQPSATLDKLVEGDKQSATPSFRSKLSVASRRNIGSTNKHPKNNLLPIDEAEEIMLISKSGQVMQLNEKQLQYLHALNNGETTQDQETDAQRNAA